MKRDDKIITFDKSALKPICKALKIPYDKNIVAIVNGKVIKNIFDLIELTDKLLPIQKTKEGK